MSHDTVIYVPWPTELEESEPCVGALNLGHSEAKLIANYIFVDHTFFSLVFKGIIMDLVALVSIHFFNFLNCRS